MTDRYLIVDIGNTRMKCALFNAEGASLTFDCETTLESLKENLGEVAFYGGLWSSVRVIPAELEVWFTENGVRKFTCDTPVPIVNRYKTPQTLGMDRVAAAVGAWTLHKGVDLLVVDMGTAITFDFVNSAGEYLGGNIAPGMNLRYRSLAEHTGALPLVQGVVADFCWGDTTESAIRSGVINGIRAEIEGYINRLKQNNSELLVFLTGGDLNIFDIREKSGIFAVKNLVITGLDCIYRYNEGKK